MPHPVRGGTGRLSALDGLRAIAIAAVVVYHFDPSWLPGGNLGVDVFFVISGYLITSTLLRRWLRGGARGILQFWLRRLRRLFPALFAMVTLVTAVLLAFPADLRVRLGWQLFGALTYTSNWLAIAVNGSYFDQTSPQVFAHLWSLAVEEQFYLVWPLLLAAIVACLPRRWPRIGVAMALAFASAAGMALAYVPGADPSPVYLATHTHAFGLMVGAALAFWRPVAGLRPLRMSTAAVQVLSLGSAAVVIASFWVLAADADITYRGGMLLLCLATAVLAATLSDDRCWSTRLLASRPFVWVGRRSYSLYLWHWPLIIMGGLALAVEPAPVGQVLRVVVPIVVSVAAAAASYRWIERPVIAFGFRGALHRLHSVLQPRRLVRAGVVAGAAVVTVALALSVLSAPAKTSAEKFIEAGEDHTVAGPQEASAPPSSAPPSSAPPSSAPPSSELPASAVGPLSVRSDQLVAVGDSVMLASAPALTAAFPGIAVDAKVARQAPATLGDATQWLQQEPNRQVVILHTGTNGTVRADDLSRFLDAAGPDRRIVLVNIHAERSWTQADNALLEKVAAEHTNVAIADWSGRISGHPDMLAADGIHPNKRGQQEYVAAVRDALAQLEVTVEAP